MTFTEDFLRETVATSSSPSTATESRHWPTGIAAVRERDGRLFILGVGGSAGSASHAVNDFRKICDVESYSPIDNVSELTARANDEGWDTTFASGSRARGSTPRTPSSSSRSAAATPRRRSRPTSWPRSTSPRSVGASIFGIVGRDGGYTAQLADACVIVPPTFADHITPHTEGLCCVIWHLLVSHPALAATATKWESVV